MPTSTYTKSGTKATTAAKLNKEIFEVSVNSHELLKQVYVAQQSAARSNNAVTKLRGEVSGGGKKPWKQKGTGRARVGSIRSPLWRGGGITFGPTGIENYTKKVNKQAKKTALRQALSLKNHAGSIIVIEDFDTKGKVKDTTALLSNIGSKGRTLLVVDSYSELVDRSTRNIARTKAVQANYLNVVDLLDAETVIITNKALEAINVWLGGKK